MPHPVRAKSPKLAQRTAIPFVVVGMPRTGSTLLTSCLQQHPALTMHEELFHFVESERAMRHALSRDGVKIYFDAKRGDAIDFLRRHVFSRLKPSDRAVGLKIFAEYVECPGTDNLFARLRDEIDDVHVLHVVRRNSLDVLVSRALATLSGQWERRYAGGATAKDKIYDDIQFTVSPDIATRFFESMRRADLYFEQTFAGPRYLQIDYDDLSERTAATMAGAFKFLRRKTVEFEVALEKQKTRRNIEIIANYAELKAAFAATAFAGFFDDEEAPRRGRRRKPLSAPERILPRIMVG